VTLRGHTVALFPAAWLLFVLMAIVALARDPGARALLALVAIVYVVPVACFRMHNLLWPLSEGRSRLDAPQYSSWWAAHHFQLIYIAFPALESALRLVPGLYSAWLRLWGSRIGRRVHWTPRVDITDRSLLDVGDGVVFGDRVACYCHVVTRRRGALVLYVRRIRIGDGALIGAACRLGPGVRVDAGAALPNRTDVFIGRRIRAPLA
jgi:hypothetical protein